MRQIKLLIKCDTSEYLNIVAYSLFLLSFDVAREEGAERSYRECEKCEKSKERKKNELHRGTYTILQLRVTYVCVSGDEKSVERREKVFF